MKKGEKMTEEAKKKISEANKGRKFSPETRKRMSRGQRGRKHTEETKRKISEANKGRDNSGEKNPMFGRKHTEEAKLKNSEAHKGKILPWKQKERIRKSCLGINKGRKNGNWKGGVSPFVKRLRESSKYYQWRRMVFERDKYECQKCLKKGGINAHHLKKFTDIVKENKIKTLKGAYACDILWDISNGITLCELCHKEAHHQSNLKL